MSYHSHCCHKDEQIGPGMAWFQLVVLLILVGLALAKGCADLKRTFFPSDPAPVKVEKD